MLIGEYWNNLGQKNRIAVPKKFRDALGTELIITQGYEGCLLLISPSIWQNLLKEAATGPFVSASVRDTTRFLMGSATEVTLDPQGRFVIPESLLKYSGIKKELAFLGLGRWVEIWDKDKWQKRKTYLFEHSSKIAEKLSQIEV